MREKIIKKIKILFVVVCIGGVLVGCGRNENSADNNNNDNGTEEKEKDFSAKDAIKIEDIDWTVTDAILDGERYISFNYTNNSDYTILDIEMEFQQKEAVTDEELSVFDSLKEKREWTDDDVRNIYVLGYNRKCADPGEMVSDSPCVINGTYTLVENMEEFELMEPEMVSIAYIGDDGKGYAIYYDYKTQTYGESSSGGEDLNQWSDSEISGMLPKAECKAIKVSFDDEDMFYFDGYGVSREEYAAYVAAVKDKGLTDVIIEGDNSYMASNEEGYEVNITYAAVEEKMEVCITIE